MVFGAYTNCNSLTAMLDIVPVSRNVPEGNPLSICVPLYMLFWRSILGRLSLVSCECFSPGKVSIIVIKHV